METARQSPSVLLLLLHLCIHIVYSYTWSADLPSGSTSVEYQLKQHLMRGYDVTSRPVRKDSTAIVCSLGMSLFHILDTSERHQTVSALLSLRVHWTDEYMKWNESRYPIKKIWIPSRSIWRPDLIIANYANDEYSDYINTNAIVQSDGSVMWTFPIVAKMYCTLDVRYFPFDTQECNVTLTSWTYDGFRLSLEHTGPGNQKVYYIERNQEWMVSSIQPYLEEKSYPCCPEPFPMVHFTIHMYRRCLFYVINLICPCLLIYCVSILGFYLPIESGEKVNLEITVLLALVVFLLMVSEAMPPTPDAVPVVGLLFSVTMLMVALAVVMAVSVTRCYFTDPQTPPPASVLRLAAWHRRRHRDRRRHKSPARGLARLRRVDPPPASTSGDVAGSLGSVNEDFWAAGGPPWIPPSASYFKVALSGASSAAAARTSVVNGSAQAAADTSQQQQKQRDEDSKDFANHWKAAAFALDRIFFWIFVSLTCIMFITVSWVASPAFHVKHPTRE